MANFPQGQGALPGVFSQVTTQTRGASVPGNGLRVSCLIGTGQRSEIIIASALGSGKDGLNPTYTSTTGSDGRHFLLTFFPIISNRTQLFRNGIPLQGVEATVTTTPFSNAYDYRIDITTGEIEMQRAHLVDQGGSFYTVGSTNVGLGTLQALTLTDVNAPKETWTIKCISVQRNNLNQPIAGTARFVAFGSVSGNLLDANGQPIVWIANNTVATNGVLSFSIMETNSLIPFREGDFFTVKVDSGVLNRNDSLTASYIAVSDLNDPTFFTSLTDLAVKHGSVSLDNTLTLGAQLAFANSPPGVMALQAAPPLPRRTSYEIETNFPATSTNCNDFILPLPLGVTPDPNSSIHFFVTNPATGVEKQLLPNKFPYYTLGTTGNPAVCTFVNDNVNPPGGNSFSYSVIQQNATVNFGQDGYLNRFLTTQVDGYFGSASFTFDSTDVGRTLNIIDSVNLANIGSFAIVGVSGGTLHIQAQGTPPFADFINEGSASFVLVDSVTGANVPGTTGTVSIVASANTATATMVASINLTAFSPAVNHYRLKITSATNASNLGLFDVTGFTGPSTMTVAKSFVSESFLKFEVVDTSLVSNYVVVNHNVVPNGYSLRVTLVDLKDSTFFDAGWETALATLTTQELDILVPLPKQTISVIFENCLNHCLEMSSIRNRKERVLFIGAINGLTSENLTGAKLAAVEDIGILEGIQGATISDVLSGNTEDLANYSVVDAFGETFRVVYFFPDQIVVQVGTQNQIIDGFYIAAAAAGFLSGVSNVAVPLTNKILSGFTILKNRIFSQTTLEALAAAGVTICTPVAGGGRVVWGKTTTQSGFPEEEEISIVFIRDKIAKTMRQGFGGFIGSVEDPDTQGTLVARATALLNSFLTQRLITDYANLTVKRDEVEPRQWDISVSVQPSYPVNWIFIQLSVGTL